MPTLSDLVVRHTALDAADLDWLHSLVSDWQLLADLSFADLILWAPLLDRGSQAGVPAAESDQPRGDSGWIAIAQMRPTTGPTVYHDDIVGSVAAKGERNLIDTAWNERRICREGDPDWSTGVPVREETIPVRRAMPDGDGRFLGVIQRSTNLSSARTPSRLELTYLQSASDLAQMVAEGRFPFSGEEPILVRSPRVGDGLLR
ncbi:histidine kinase N-terminal domain-containing protein, partial [Nonomuraea mangrovi]